MSDLTASRNEAYGMLNIEPTASRNEAYGTLSTEPEYAVVHN